MATRVTDYRALLNGSYWFPIPSAASPIAPTPQPMVLTYSFSQAATASITASSPATAATFQAFSASDEAVARTELQQWAQVSGVTFLETTMSEGDITFGYYTLSKMGYSNTAGLGYYPSAGAYITSDGTLATYDNQVIAAGDVYVDTSYIDSAYLQADLGHVLIHEIGHTLGLKHPFDNGAYTLDPALDNGTETVMSYSGARLAVLGPLDVAAVQSIYGDYGATSAAWNWSWDAIDEVYTVHSVGDGQFVRGVGARSDIIYAPGLDDAVVTAQGDDVIYAAGQSLSINAGLGNDTVYTGLTYASLSWGVQHDSAYGQYYAYAGASYQQYYGVETLVFSDGVYSTAAGSFTPLAPLTVEAEFAALAEGGGPFVFDLIRTDSIAASRVVNWVVAGSGAAPADAADFAGGVLPSGQVTFAAGQTSQSVTVAVSNDTLLEGDEQFTLYLSDFATGVAAGSASATILNDDTSLSIAATDASKAEGDSGSTAFTFTVSRTGDLSGASSAAWAVIGAAPSSANPVDFVGGAAPSGTVNFVAGESSQTITVAVQGDTLAEADEHFQVVLVRPVGATVAGASAVATILNDDTNFAIASTTGSRPEGDSGATTPFVFTVTRSGVTDGANSVAWGVVGAQPNSAGPGDFVGGAAPSGTLSFAPGELSQTITVDVAGDTQLEPDEYFQVVLAHPTGGAAISTGAALAKIVNDDTGFSIAATDAVKAEGDAGATMFTFTVTQTGNIANTHSVRWQVSGALPNTAGRWDFVGNAAPGGDLLFTPGEVSKTITVAVQGDTTVEPDEHFTVLLHRASGGAAILVGHAEGTILNDDGGPPADINGALAAVATADFNGDGTADVLRQASGGDLYVLDGASGVQSPLSQSGVSQAGAGLSFVAAADFNGDGRSDLLLQGGGGGLYDWTMDGASVVQSDLVTLLGSGQTVAGVDDYSGDGRADILLANGASGGWTLLQMQGGTVASSQNLASLPEAWHVG